MALPVISSSDFVGWLKISADTFQAAKLQRYIDRFYISYLRKILGYQASKEIIDNDPLFDKWVDVLNGVYYYNISCDGYMQTTPLLDIIKGLIYFEFVRDNFISTNTGLVKNTNENSTNLTGVESNYAALNRFNDAVAGVNDLLLPFFDNYQDYTVAITGFVDNGGDSYTIQTASTLYLIDGDTVKIDDTEYTVSNVITDTSFDITSTVATSFDGDYIHSPFDYVPNLELQFITV